MAVRSFCERWLVNGIQEDYKNWLPRGVEGHQKASRIFIESPTGTGKSSFVLNKLFPFAAENNYNVLYLTNRSALNQQMRNTVAQKLESCKQKSIAEMKKVPQNLRDRKRA